MLLPYSLILRHLLGKRFVCQTGRAVGIVGQHAMCTGSAFCRARTDRDFCTVDFQRVTVGAAQGGAYFFGLVGALGHHRQYNAVNIQPGIDTALYLVDGFEQGHQTFEGEMLRLHRNHHPVSRNKRCYGDAAQRGHTVDQAEVEFILDDAEAPVRMGQVADFANASLQSETLVTAAGPEFEKSSSEEEPLAEDTSKELMLVVEDNQELREFLRSIFTPVYRVVEAADGMEGWSKALKDLPDIIISDVMMPEKDGIEMARELRADMMTSHIPIILLTAKTTIESKLEGLEYGADDYITKPFSATYLQARVENLLIQRKKLQSFYRDSLMHIHISAGQEDAPVATDVPSAEEDTSETVPATLEMSPNDRKFMDKLVELMEQNMDNGELVVDDLVRELAVSRSVFFKKLKTLTGLAPIEFIKEMRIKRATQLIETGEFNMTQISYMVGINDPRYFSKCFKAQVGMTPTEYRDKVGR